MFWWVRESRHDLDHGFTMIDLLVVMGVTVAIAVPVLWNQCKKAVDTSVRSGVRSANLTPGSARDDGFTLIEMVVAMMLMTLVLTSVGAFMVRSVYATSALSGRQGAVTVANQVLQQTRAVDATFNATGVSPLTAGRGKTAVVAQWASAASAGLDVSGTYTGSGTTTFDAHTYQTSGTPAVPLSQTLVNGPQSYTVDTLIGTCVRASAGSTCGQLTSGTELFRIVVRVTWVPGAGRTCSGSICSYVVTTLIDPAQNPTFNVNRAPLANNDVASVVTGSSGTILISSNDSGDLPATGAVTITTSPAHGSVTLSATNNTVTFIAAPGYSGTDSFSYTVTDKSGLVSNVATVSVSITPAAVADASSTVAGGTAAAVSVLSNDQAGSPSLTSITTPSLGSAAISGNTILYTPPAAESGTTTVTYTAKDSSNQEYTGILTMTVKPGVTTAGSCWPGWYLSAGSQIMSLTLAATDLIGTGTLTISNPALTSSILTASVSVSGRTFTYRLPAATPLPQTFTYTLTDGAGITNTVTMSVRGVC